MGMVTGIGGGMMRDVLAGNVPVVFEGNLYATPALAGAAVAVLLDRTDLPVLAVAAFGFCHLPGLAAAGARARLERAPAPGPRQRLSGPRPSAPSES